MNFRSGISEDNVTGKGWEKISLKCRKVDRSESIECFNERNDEPIIEPVIMDSQFFLPIEQNPKEIKKIYIEDSIFDSIYETNDATKIDSYIAENKEYKNEIFEYVNSNKINEGIFLFS